MSSFTTDHEGASVQALFAVLCVAVAATLAAGTPALASDTHGGHAAHPHHVSLMLGAADNHDLHETGFTIGASYRYSVAPRFAVGPMIDFAFYDHETTTLLVAAVFWKPAGNLVLLAGPGVEFAHVDDSAGHEGGTESEFAFRIGAGYELHAGGLTVTPVIGTDFVNGHTTVVYAVEFGIGF